jgi:hypothetical protein
MIYYPDTTKFRTSRMCDDDWDGGAERGVMFCVAGADDDAYVAYDGAPYSCQVRYALFSQTVA